MTEELVDPGVLSAVCVADCVLLTVADCMLLAVLPDCVMFVMLSSACGRTTAGIRGIM